MKELRIKIAKNFGSENNLADLINNLYKAGMDPFLMLVNWHRDVMWKKAEGEPRYYRDNTAWICYHEGDDRYFIRLHEARSPEQKRSAQFDNFVKRYLN